MLFLRAHANCVSPMLGSLMRHLEAARTEAATAEDRVDAAIAALAKAARGYAGIAVQQRR